MAGEFENQRGEDGYLTVDNLQHHYLHWGDSGADPVVLLHGFFEHARSLEPVARRLASSYSVFGLDLRGHGETAHAPGGYLVWEFARDLHAVVEALDLEVFDLIAFGAGARIAMTYGRDHSHRIKHLVLAGEGPEPPEDVFHDGAATVDSFATEEEALAHFARLYPGESTEFHMRQLMASLELDDETGHLVFRFDPGLRDASGGTTTGEIPFLWESLEHITSPTLIVRGANSRVLKPDVAEAMLERLPNGRLEELPDTEDGFHARHAEAFTSLVSRFLAE